MAVWWFSVHAPLRDNVPGPTIAVLECWAAGRRPSAQQLEELPLGLSTALAATMPTRWMPYGDVEHGAPVMIATHRNKRILTMNMFVQEDAFAEGGWRIFSWVFDLVDRSFSGPVATMWHDEEGDVEIVMQIPRPEGSQLARVSMSRNSREQDLTHAFSVGRVGVEPTDSFAGHLTEPDDW